MTHRPISRPRALRSAALGCTLFAALGAAASSAQAGSYEQISRYPGATGAAPFTTEASPIFTSDTGRYAAFESRPFGDGVLAGLQAPTVVRDIVNNSTSTFAKASDPVTDSTERVYGVDQWETTALVSGTQGWALRPTGGGADRPIAMTASTGTSLDPYDAAALSGDASTVAAFDDRGKLKTVAVATGAETRYGDLLAGHFGPQSISDNGGIVTGTRTDYEGDVEGGFALIYGTFLRLANPARVSPDASVITTLSDASDALRVYKVAASTEKSYALPASGSFALGWVSPDGGRIAIVPTRPGSQSWVLDVATGKWSTFGSVYSSALDITSRISRNGRYATVEYDRDTPLRNYGSSNGFTVSQAALVDLTNADLPGDQEPLSASSYLAVTPPVLTSCSATSGVLFAKYGRPAAGFPVPKNGTLTVLADGAQIYKQAFTAATPAGAPVQVPYSGTAKSLTITAKTTDAQGTSATSTETIPVRCYVDLPF